MQSNFVCMDDQVKAKEVKLTLGGKSLGFMFLFNLVLRR